MRSKSFISSQRQICNILINFLKVLFIPCIRKIDIVPHMYTFSMPAGPQQRSNARGII
jgi:hypothetical protein